MTARHLCPLCQHETELYVQINRLPQLQNVLYATNVQALASPSVDVAFRICNECEFLYNPEFALHDLEYNPDYNNNQTASGTYQRHVAAVTDLLTQTCQLHPQSRVLEIACGNGYFLKTLQARAGLDAVVGYDPAYADQYGLDNAIVKDYFAAIPGDTYDLIVLRHALESVVEFEQVMQSIAESLNETGWLYIETLNLDYITSSGNFTCLSHECSRYFSLQAVSILLRQYGLKVRQAVELFDRNYLGVFAQLKAPNSNVTRKIDFLNTLAASYERPVIWGISGRAITALTHLGWDANKIRYGVDIDQSKQGKFIPGTGQEIISAAAAIDYKPDLVLVSNKNYLTEIMSSFPYQTTFATIDGEFCGTN